MHDVSCEVVKHQSRGPGELGGSGGGRKVLNLMLQAHCWAQSSQFAACSFFDVAKESIAVPEEIDPLAV